MTILGRFFIPTAMLALCLLVSCENEKSKEVTKEKTVRTIEKQDRDADDR